MYEKLFFSHTITGDNCVNKVYLCIDLKSFYASVECVERGLNPMKSNLVVADPTRGQGAICLAVSPHLKQLGVRNRCRLYEIPENIDYITAIPRMKIYMEYSVNIYAIYLKYVAKEDIHVYSIDEAFLDITSYLKFRKLNPISFAKMILKDIYETYGLIATVGIGTNLYLAKIALDIISKSSPTYIGVLDEKTYIEKLSFHEPLSDFWQIGIHIEKHLNRLNIHNMYELSKADEKLLYQEFGINAKFLIDHSKGIEPATIKEIKEYKPQSKSLSIHQTLLSDYSMMDARGVLVEMLDILYLELIRQNLYTSTIHIYVGYSKDKIKALSVSCKLKEPTNSFQKLLSTMLKIYTMRVDKVMKIRKLGLALSNLSVSTYQQLNFFEKENDDTNFGNTIYEIKDKYGKNSIFRGVSLLKKSTALKRNKLIGGHNAEGEIK